MYSTEEPARKIIFVSFCSLIEVALLATLHSMGDYSMKLIRTSHLEVVVACHGRGKLIIVTSVGSTLLDYGERRIESSESSIGKTRRASHELDEVTLLQSGNE